MFNFNKWEIIKVWRSTMDFSKITKPLTQVLAKRYLFCVYYRVFSNFWKDQRGFDISPYRPTTELEFTI